MNKSLGLVFGLALSITAARAGTVNYVCASNINTTEAGTCNYLKTIVAGDYSSVFSNANANIYIQYGSTGLAESTIGYYNTISFSNYLQDLTVNATASGNPIQAAAIAALNAVDASTYYQNSSVVITSALGEALGVPNIDLAGTTASGQKCTIGTGVLGTSTGCYNGIITLSTTATWYYDSLGGNSSGYDAFAAVEHETDEILGTASCIDTQNGGVLTDPCPGALGADTPSAVDLFRYNSDGNLALNSSYIGDSSAPAGAYFSYNGGLTNGADGNIYNTSSSQGLDYADFVTNCAGTLSIQDTNGCPGEEAGLTILTDGNAEINILNAVGYEESAPVAPEPATTALFGTGLVFLGLYKRRRRA